MNVVTGVRFRDSRPARRLKRRPALLSALVLAATLVAAQAVAVAHDPGPDGHPAGETTCAVCIAVGSLTGGPAAAPQAVVVDQVHERGAAVGAVLLGAAPPAAYDARAPPLAS